MSSDKKDPIDELFAHLPLWPETWWWLSFCDTSKPPGKQFVAAAIVKARSFLDAVLVARKRGCNPGGEVQGIECLTEPKEGWAYRLLTEADCKEFARVHDATLSRAPTKTE